MVGVSIRNHKVSVSSTAMLETIVKSESYAEISVQGPVLLVVDHCDRTESAPLVVALISQVSPLAVNWLICPSIFATDWPEFLTILDWEVSQVLARTIPKAKVELDIETPRVEGNHSTLLPPSTELEGFIVRWVMSEFKASESSTST